MSRALPRPQRGVALLIALLVVALATILIAGLLDRGELAAARTRNLLRNEQVDAFQQGLEAYAARVLVRDLENGAVDANGDIWAIPLPPTPVSGGTISASMRDLDGCFNLNNLTPGLAASSLWRARFDNLLKALGLDPAIAPAVADWIDADRDPTDNGAEDNAYLANTPPYRAADRPFADVSELRLVRGVTGEVYARLAPYVCAVPAGNALNLNTASVPVLRSLDPAITQAMAERLWRDGQANRSGVDVFVQELQQLGVSLAPTQQVALGVKSHYFLATGLIDLDGISFATTSLMARPEGGAPRVLQRGRAEQ